MTDERGIVSTYTYDVVLGVVTQQTLNVQAGVTAPGVNVVTDFTYDEQGRPHPVARPAAHGGAGRHGDDRAGGDVAGLRPLHPPALGHLGAGRGPRGPKATRRARAPVTPTRW